MLRQADGAGLSGRNMICPRACVQVLPIHRLLTHHLMCTIRLHLILRSSLQLLQGKAANAEWHSFFPVAAESGSLAGRFHGTIAASKLHAKTGTLAGVAALSGYYKNLVFSIMANCADAHVEDPDAEIRAAVDQVALALCAFVDEEEHRQRTTARL